MDMVDYTIRVPKGMVPYLADDDYQHHVVVMANLDSITVRTADTLLVLHNMAALSLYSFRVRSSL